MRANVLLYWQRNHQNSIVRDKQAHKYLMYLFLDIFEKPILATDTGRLNTDKYQFFNDNNHNNFILYQHLYIGYPLIFKQFCLAIYSGIFKAR